jgi:hypothetical protein
MPGRYFMKIVSYKSGNVGRLSHVEFEDWEKPLRKIFAKK